MQITKQWRRCVTLESLRLAWGQQWMGDFRGRATNSCVSLCLPRGTVTSQTTRNFFRRSLIVPSCKIGSTSLYSLVFSVTWQQDDDNRNMLENVFGEYFDTTIVPFTKLLNVGLTGMFCAPLISVGFLGNHTMKFTLRTKFTFMRGVYFT